MNILARLKKKLQIARSRYASVDVTVATFKAYSKDDGGFYSAALTYYVFLSLFPLLLFVAAAVGYLTLSNAGLQQDILNVAAGSPLLSQVLTAENMASMQDRRGAIAATASLLALYSGTGAVVALGHALNRIAGVTAEGSFLSKRLRAVKWLATLGAAAVASLALGTVAGYAADLFDTALAQVGAVILGHAIGVFVGVFIFASAFRSLQRERRPWREVLPGAVLAACCLEILKEAGAWYLQRGASARAATFGAFAAAAGLLVASYLIAQITLLAAELNAVLAERRSTRHSG